MKAISPGVVPQNYGKGPSLVFFLGGFGIGTSVAENVNEGNFGWNTMVKQFSWGHLE